MFKDSGLWMNTLTLVSLIGFALIWFKTVKTDSV